MLNEGIVTNDVKVEVKSTIIHRIRELGPTTPDALEAIVFKMITGHTRDEVDWDIEDNQAGYYLWVQAFDGSIEELVEDGYIRVEAGEKSGEKRLVAAETDPALGVCQVPSSSE